jgi:diketogulonate reductase-like aldo/keto reductase
VPAVSESSPTATVSRHRNVRGHEVPSFLYGTAWKEERTRELTELALRSGFRGIDTANQRRHYLEAAVGEAVAAVLAESELARADLFLQTKFTFAAGQDHRIPYDPEADFATQVAQSFESSLEHLQTDYVDAYVLHGPSVRRGLSRADLEVWGAMEALQRAGKAKLIGVSNVSAEQISALLDEATVKPAFVQNRCFARLGWDRSVRRLCAAHDIVYQGFSLLTANLRELLRSPVVQRVASRTGKTLPQVVFRFALQVGMIPLTGTSREGHMRDDLAVFDFELSDSDVEAIERLAG